MASSQGPVLIAYDGSELSGHAIAEAGKLLAAHCAALVVCVWHPADVGFNPVGERRFDADDASEVQHAAEETARQGASLAEAAGFSATYTAFEAAPAWKGIVDIAKEREARLIVMGSHRHSGLLGHLGGSVAAAVISHSSCTVLLVHSLPSSPLR